MRKLLACLGLIALLATPAAASARPVAASAGRAHPAPRVLPSPVPCPGCWAPALHTSWQWQLQYKVDTSVDVQMYDIDGFDSPKKLVAKLHADGRAVVCYLSAGSWENWRPDAGDFPDSVKGRPNGWPGERWLDIRRLGILGPIMKARLDMCQRQGLRRGGVRQRGRVPEPHRVPAAPRASSCATTSSWRTRRTAGACRPC